MRPLEQLIDASRRLLVVYEGDLLPDDARTRRRRLDCLSAMVQTGIRNVVASPSDAAEIQRHAPRWVLFTDTDPLAPDLPPGAIAYILGLVGMRSGSLLLPPDPTEPHQPRILIVPTTTSDPDRPDAFLTERYSGRRIGLADLCEAVSA
jgi:hypothetical protein